MESVWCYFSMIHCNLVVTPCLLPCGFCKSSQELTRLFCGAEVHAIPIQTRILTNHQVDIEEFRNSHGGSIADAGAGTGSLSLLFQLRWV